MSLTLDSIHVYPVKSLGGFAVNEAQLTDRGLLHDRRWMLVDEDGVFITQREVPAMACLHTAPIADGFRVTDIRDGATLDLPWQIETGDQRMCDVWSDRVRTISGDPRWNVWFSERLGRHVAPVLMPDATKRRTDDRYAKGLTSLSDGFPYLIVSQASLDDLNGRSSTSVGMERFRPNLVVSGGTAYQEDAWTAITIGAVPFRLVKPCARCAIITTDQRTGERGREPLRTLATYRSKGNKVLFGMNAVADGSGSVRVGDLVSA